MSESLHAQIAGDLRDRIVRGVLAAGDPLPSEHDLCVEYGASRGTVRRALAELAGEGLVTNGQGRARHVRHDQHLTFYASRSESRTALDERRASGVDAWVADVEAHGGHPAQQITVAIEQPPAAIAALLQLPAGDLAVTRRRIRSIDGRPHNLNTTWYPRWIAENTPIMQPADVPQGVSVLLADLRYEQTRYVDEITARMPGPDETRRLRIGPGIPVMIHTRTGYAGGDPVRVAVTVWPADRAGIVFELPA
jgi:GntR family transcriptional regulator